MELLKVTPKTKKRISVNFSIKCLPMKTICALFFIFAATPFYVSCGNKQDKVTKINEYINCANEKVKERDHLGAIEYLSKAIELSPNDYGLYFARGSNKIETEDYLGMVEDFSKVIELNPNNSEAYRWVCYAKQELKDYLGVIEEASKLIELNPNDEMADGYTYRGYAKFEINDYLGAIEDLLKIIEFIPDFLDPYDKCIEAYIQLNDYENAKKMQERKLFVEKKDGNNENIIEE